MLNDGSFLHNPDEYVIPLSTKYLKDTYPDRFEEIKVKERYYYLEKPMSDTVARDHRYLGYISDSGNLNSKDSLARLSGEKIWERSFSEEELERINKALILIKIAINSKDMNEDSFDRDVDMNDGTKVNVEYVPYIPENISSVIEDLG